jgi:CBS domain-containing protein
VRGGAVASGVPPGHDTQAASIREVFVLVSDIMSTADVGIGPDAPVPEVVRRLVEGAVGALAVVEADGSAVGVVTEADVLARVAYHDHEEGPGAFLSGPATGSDARWLPKADAVTAREVMSSRLVSVAPDDDVREAARRMLEQRVAHLPVVSDGRVVGMVSRRHLLRASMGDDRTGG